MKGLLSKLNWRLKKYAMGMVSVSGTIMQTTACSKERHLRVTLQKPKNIVFLRSQRSPPEWKSRTDNQRHHSRRTYFIASCRSSMAESHKPIFVARLFEELCEPQ